MMCGPVIPADHDAFAAEMNARRPLANPLPPLVTAADYDGFAREMDHDQEKAAEEHRRLARLLVEMYLDPEERRRNLAILTAAGLHQSEAHTGLHRIYKTIAKHTPHLDMALNRLVGRLPADGSLQAMLRQISDDVDDDIQELQRMFPDIYAFRAALALIHKP